METNLTLQQRALIVALSELISRESLHHNEPIGATDEAGDKTEL